MRVTTTKIIDIYSGTVLLSEGYEYSGTWDLLKGDQVAQQAEAQQSAFSAQLAQIFQAQYSQQSATLQYLQGKLEPIIDKGGVGYDDATLAAMRTSATDATSTAYQNAQKALQAKQFATQGRDIPAGAIGQEDEALLSAAAGNEASSQDTITLNNANLKAQTYWNAVNALSGNTAMFNPQSYAGASTSADNSVAGLSQAVTASAGPSFGSILGGVAGGALSGASGAGGLFSKICWLARASFGGWLDPRTIMVRHWLLTDFSTRWYGGPIMALYAKYGERMAQNPTLVRLTRPLFYMALDRAREA
jgi:hypothetical protein